MMKQTTLAYIMFAMLAFGLFDRASAELAYQTAWTRQLGTPEWDGSLGVSVDGLGNVYISGWTYGELDEPNAGATDAFLSKYDHGNLVWTRQLGTPTWDASSGVSADGLGNVYICGETDGALDGSNAGGLDAFVAKYDEGGNLLWTRQLGTYWWDTSSGVSADGLGNVYISGFTKGDLEGRGAGLEDAFVSKYDGDGNLLWTRQPGTWDIDKSDGVSADGLGNVYITGYTRADLAGPHVGSRDAFLIKYDSDGDVLWSEQLGTLFADRSFGVSADGLGNVYICGETQGDLGDGEWSIFDDAFVAKYDEAGNLLWTQELGTPDWDSSFAVSADGLGNVYISGWTDGDLDGPNAGDGDAFVAKYDGTGNLLWTRQFGTLDRDQSWGVSADGLGNVYVSGDTFGDLGGPNIGGSDAFVAMLSPIPEPSTLALLGMGAIAMLCWIRKRS